MHAADVRGDSRRIGGFVGNFGTLPDLGAIGFVESDHRAVLAAGRANQLLAVDQHGFGEIPARHHFAAEVGFEILAPHFLAVGRIETDQVRELSERVDEISVDRRRAARAVVVAARLANLCVPDNLAVQVERVDVAGAFFVAHGEDFTASDGDAGVAAANAFGLPGERRTVGRPLLQQAGFGRDVVAVGTAELRPIVGRDVTGVSSSEQHEGAQERDKGFTHGRTSFHGREIITAQAV